MAKEIPFLFTRTNKEGVGESGPPKGRLGRQRQGLWDEEGPYGSETLTLDLENQLGWGGGWYKGIVWLEAAWQESWK